MARVDGGWVASDGGGILLKEVDDRFQFLSRFAACFTDHRDPERIEHLFSALAERGSIFSSSAGGFQFTRNLLYQGRRASLCVTETTLTITKPGRRRTPGGGRVVIPGPPLTVRLIVTENWDEDDQVLARWYLVINMFDAAITADLIALWYDRR